MEQVNELQNHIHCDYKEREEMRAAGLQGQEGGEANMEKLKFPSLGGEDPNKDAKLTSKEYLVWRKGVELWRNAGGVPNHGMGPYLFGALKGQPRTTVMLAVSSEVLASPGGVAAIFLELDQLFMGDMASQAMSLSGELLKMRRKPGEAIEDFCTRFTVAVNACNGIQIGMHQ